MVKTTGYCAFYVKLMLQPVLKEYAMEYRETVEVEFQEFGFETLEKSWEWLNDPEIKRLTNTPDFDRDDQVEWFNGLSSRTDYYIQSVSCNGVIVGACGLKKITTHDAELWMYIGEKAYWGKTIGIQMLEHVIEYARLINLNSIYGKYMKFNHSSINLGKRFGFVYERDISDEMILMRLIL